MLDKLELIILDIAPQVYNGAKEFFKKAKILTLDIDINSVADFIADLCENNSDKIPFLISINYLDFIVFLG